MLVNFHLVTLLSVALGNMAQAGPAAAPDSVSVRETVLPALVARNVGDVEGDFVVIQQEETVNGTLVWFGADTALAQREALEDSRLDKRVNCGNNNVPNIYCDGYHVPPVNLCGILADGLYGSGYYIPNAPRSVCLTQGTNRCCVSWSKHVDGLEGHMLYRTAARTFLGCIAYKKSGLARSANINDVCMTQCMSDRPNDCTGN